MTVTAIDSACRDLVAVTDERVHGPGHVGNVGVAMTGHDVQDGVAGDMGGGGDEVEIPAGDQVLQHRQLEL